MTVRIQYALRWNGLHDVPDGYVSHEGADEKSVRARRSTRPSGTAMASTGP